MNRDLKFAVLGGGSWATAIVKMLTENVDSVQWFMRNTDAIEHIRTQGHNPNYLSSVEFHVEKLRLTNDINEGVLMVGADLE
jgi:glycerol-3-phosphate dehydrogenase (NAD(P)+)